MVNSEQQQILKITSNKGWFVGLNEEEILRLVRLSQVKTYWKKAIGSEKAPSLKTL